MKIIRQSLWVILLTQTLYATAGEDLKIVKNQIYAMHSGTALLFDTHYPKQANGFGVVFIPGSGWHADGGYDAPGLKDLNSGWPPGDTLAKSIVQELLAKGFTVFVINHRAAPRFRYPAAIDDAAQAVSFIRKNADQFAIDPNKIAGVGTSSGGTLVSLLGTSDDVSLESRLQAVATVGAPMDMVSLYYSGSMAAGTLSGYFGFNVNFLPPEHPDVQTYHTASPTFHISPDDAPHLLVHGDKDELVPLEQSLTAKNLFADNSVKAEVIVVKDGKHSENLLQHGWHKQLPKWFLKNFSGKSPK